MKTLLLFHRLELTDMFAPVGNALAGKAHIVHLAYSDDECKMLEAYGVKSKITVFKDEIRKLWEGKVDISPEALEAIDAEILTYTNGKFNLNAALQSDRGFSNLSNQEALRLTAVYMMFWRKFLADNNIDFVMHEPVSLMMNFICAVQCKRLDAYYIYQIMMLGRPNDLAFLTIAGLEFSCLDIDRLYAEYKSGEKAVDTEDIGQFLQEFRSSFEVYLGDSISITTSRPGLWARSLRNRLRRATQLKALDRVLDNIDHWGINQDLAAERLRNLLRYEREIDFQEYDENDRYYYYPLHLEPEAVVLYHGGGMYVNQVKLIQNIAAQLPAGTVLYVKDHPHDVGYRSADDYLAFQAIPNVKLIRHNISGKRLVKDCIGIFTINGTTGLEALFMGKQVYIFGDSVYRNVPQINNIEHIRDLRDLLYQNQDIDLLADETDLMQFASAYLGALAPGMVDFFAGRAKTYDLDQDQNIQLIANDFLRLAGHL